MDAIHNLLNAEALLASFGPWVLAGIAVVVFIESGVLFPFLPGDSLLVTAAILSSQLNITHWELWLVAAIAAIAGDQVGYHLGLSFGRRFFKPDARVLKTKHLDEATAFFEKYGALALVFGRFVPIVRTFAPFVAGIGNMHYRTFAVYNIIGAITWVTLFIGAGYFFGNMSFVKNNFSHVTLGIIVFSVWPIVFEIVKARKEN